MAVTRERSARGAHEDPQHDHDEDVAGDGPDIAWPGKQFAKTSRDVVDLDDARDEVVGRMRGALVALELGGGQLNVQAVRAFDELVGKSAWEALETNVESGARDHHDKLIANAGKLREHVDALAPAVSATPDAAASPNASPGSTTSAAPAEAPAPEVTPGSTAPEAASGARGSSRGGKARPSSTLPRTLTGPAADAETKRRSLDDDAKQPIHPREQLERKLEIVANSVASVQLLPRQLAGLIEARGALEVTRQATERALEGGETSAADAKRGSTNEKRDTAATQIAELRKTISGRRAQSIDKLLVPEPSAPNGGGTATGADPKTAVMTAVEQHAVLLDRAIERGRVYMKQIAPMVQREIAAGRLPSPTGAKKLAAASKAPEAINGIAGRVPRLDGFRAGKRSSAPHPGGNAADSTARSTGHRPFRAADAPSGPTTEQAPSHAFRAVDPRSANRAVHQVANTLPGAADAASHAFRAVDPTSAHMLPGLAPFRAADPADASQPRATGEQSAPALDAASTTSAATDNTPPETNGYTAVEAPTTAATNDHEAPATNGYTAVDPAAIAQQATNLVPGLAPFRATGAANQVANMLPGFAPFRATDPTPDGARQPPTTGGAPAANKLPGLAPYRATDGADADATEDQVDPALAAEEQAAAAQRAEDSKGFAATTTTSIKSLVEVGARAFAPAASLATAGKDLQRLDHALPFAAAHAPNVFAPLAHPARLVQEAMPELEPILRKPQIAAKLDGKHLPFKLKLDAKNPDGAEPSFVAVDDKAAKPILTPNHPGGLAADYQPLSDTGPSEPAAPSPKPQGGFAKPPPKPPLPPPPQTPGQTAVNAYIENARQGRDAAKAKVHAQQHAKCTQVAVDGNALSIAAKTKNDQALAKLRTETAAQKEKAAKEAADRRAKEGPVTIESLKERLETSAKADKEKLEQTFATKKAELATRIKTQKEQLQQETKRQVDNLKKEQDAKKVAAEKAWEGQKKALTAANVKLIEQVRATTIEDQKRLDQDKDKLYKAANDRYFELLNKRAKDVEQLRLDGEKKANDAISKANEAARTKRAEAQTKAAQQRAAAANSTTTDEAEKQQAISTANTQATSDIAKADQLARDLEDKGKLAAEGIRRETVTQMEKLSDAAKKAADDAKSSADKQVAAITEKVNSLGPLGQQKIKAAETDLNKQLADGQKKLTESLKGSEDKIAKIEKEGADKLAKVETDAQTALEKDHDAALKTMDVRLEAARKQLATGNEKNIKALEAMVDQTCKALDKAVVDAEKKMDGHIAVAEQKAKAVVLDALRKVKAEADKALKEIDKAFSEAMKQIDDAVEKTHRTLEETAQGKQLEIEVHTATMLADTGDGTRLANVKAQLAEYIKRGQKIPAGYGETAKPEPPGDAAKKEGKEGKEGEAPKKDEKDKKPGDAPKDERSADDKQAAEDRAALLDPKNLSPEGIEAKVAEQIKKGQSQTNVSASEAAGKQIDDAYVAANKAVTKVADKKMQEIADLQSDDPKKVAEAMKEVEQHRKDEKAGQQAAEDLIKAAERDGTLWGKDPDKKAMLKSLEGMTPAQIEALRAALKAKGKDLDQIINSNLDGDQLTEAKIRLQGDPIAADIAALGLNGGHKLTGNERLLGGATLDIGLRLAGKDPNNAALGADQERIKEILARYKDDSKKMEAFAKAYAESTGKPLSQFLQATGNAEDAKALGLETPVDATSSEERKKAGEDEVKKLVAEANKKGTKLDTTKASSELNSALNGLHLDSTRGDMVVAALKGKSPEELALIKAQYKADTGRDLDADMSLKVEGSALIEAKAEMRGDKKTAALARIMGSEDASLTPWTVDDKKMHDALKELKDPTERRAVLEEYKKRTGKDLQETIADKMTGNDRELAKALAEGDELKARMVELDEATNGGWMNGMHKAIAERTGLPTEKLTRTLVTAAISPASLIQGDDTIVVGGHQIGNGAIHKIDSEKVFELLEQTPNPADREKLKALYKQQTGKDLDDEMGRVLTDPTGNTSKYEAYQALMEGRTADAAAARMENALDGFNDTKAFYKQLEGKSEWERKAIIEAYNKRHPNDPNAFANLCKDQLAGLDHEKAVLLANSKDDAATGVVKLPDEFVIKYANDSVWKSAAQYIDKQTEFVDKYPMLLLVPGVAQAKTASYLMRGWGVDDAAIKDVLKDKSKEEIEELKKKYPGLEADLKYTLSGRSAYEIDLMLKEGAPQTPEAKLKRALDLYEFDRGAKGEWIPGFHKISNGITDLIDPSGKSMDKQADELRGHLAMLKDKGSLPPEALAQLEYSLGMMDANTGNFLEAREAVTGAIATAVGAVVGAIVTVFTGGVGGAILAAIATGMSTIAVKTAMLGQAYGRNELGVDIAMMAVQAATGGIGASIGAQSFLGQVLTGAISNAVSSFVTTAITSKDAHDLLSLLTQASKAGLVGLASGAAGAAAQAALGKAMEKLSAKAFGQDAPLSGIFVKGFVSGGGSAVASLMAEAAFNPEMLSGNWDEVFGQLGRSFAEGGFGGALGDVAGAHHERSQAQKSHAQQTLHDAVGAAKQKQADGASLQEQQQAFADRMAKGAESEPHHTPPPEPVPTSPDAIENRLKQGPPAPHPDEAHASTPPAQGEKQDIDPKKAKQAIDEHAGKIAKDAKDAAEAQDKQPAHGEEPNPNKGKKIGEGDDWGDLNEDLGLDKPKAKDKDGWKEPSDTHPKSDAEAAHQKAVDDKLAQIKKDNPELSHKEAVRRARNEVIAEVADQIPGPAAKATKEVHQALAKGDGAAAVAAVKDIADLTQRREMIKDLRDAHDGKPLHEILASLPPEHAKQIREHLDSLPPNAAAMKHADSMMKEQADASKALDDAHASKDPAKIAAAEADVARARQKAMDALVDAYGIDDSQVNQRAATDKMGYGLKRGEIEASPMGARPHGEADKNAGFAEALPGGQVVAKNKGHDLFFDADGKPRSKEFIAAALGHEIEVHVEQLRDGRYTNVDDKVGTAINEAEAYAYMVKEAKRFGMSPEETAWCQKRLDAEIAHLEKTDPTAAERVKNGDFSVGDRDVVNKPKEPWTNAGKERSDGAQVDQDGKQIGPKKGPSLTDDFDGGYDLKFPDDGKTRMDPALREQFERAAKLPLEDHFAFRDDRIRIESERIAREEPHLTEDQVRRRAEKKVSNDEIAAGMLDDGDLDRSNEKHHPEEIPDIRRQVEEHERAVAEETLRILGEDAKAKQPGEALMSVDEAQQKARKKVVDDEIELGRGPIEKLAEKDAALKRRMLDELISGLEQINKPAADVARVIDGLVNGDLAKAGKATNDLLLKGLELVLTAKLPPETHAVVGEALKLLKEAVDTKHPKLDEIAGQLVQVTKKLATLPADVAGAAMRAVIEMPETATATERLERRAQIAERADELRQHGMSMEDAIAQAQQDIAANAEWGREMKKLADRDPELNDPKCAPDLGEPAKLSSDAEPAPVKSPRERAEADAAAIRKELEAARILERNSGDDSPSEQAQARDRLAVAEQRVRALDEQQAMATAVAAKEARVDAQAMRVAQAKHDLDLAEVAYNHKIGRGEKPTPHEVWVREEALARLSHEQHRHAEIAAEPVALPEITPKRVQGDDPPPQDSPKHRIGDDPAAQEAARDQAALDELEADQQAAPAKKQQHVAAPRHEGEHDTDLAPRRMPESSAEALQRKAAGEKFSNLEVRDYYEMRNKEIAQLDVEWQQQGLTPAERAQKAYELRHEMRMVARDMMGSPEQQLEVLVRDAQKYGDGGGPTFDQLVAEQGTKYGKTGDDAFEGIVKGSQKTDKKTTDRVNAGEDKVPDVKIPDGFKVRGDGLTFTDKTGVERKVRITRSEDGDAPRLVVHPDGTHEVIVPKKLDRQAALAGVADELGKVSHGVARPRANTREMPIVKQPVKQEPLHASGLAEPGALRGFVDAVEQAHPKWKAMDIEARSEMLAEAINTELRKRGLPEVKIDPSQDLGHSHGQFEFGDWKIAINKKHLANGDITPEQLAALANTAYHEARHAEQWYLIARHMVAGGMDVGTIQKQTGIDIATIRRALIDRNPFTPEQQVAAAKYHKSIYGADGAKRNATINALGPTKDATIAAAENYKRLAGDPHASPAERQAALAEWHRAHKTMMETEQAYRDLPEEIDAWAVGDSAGKKYGTIEPDRIITIESPPIEGPITPDRIIAVGDELAVPVSQQRDEKIAQQMAKGHSGVEVHSHFMGNVDGVVMRDVIAKAPNSSRRADDVTAYEPVLREIAAMEQHAHKPVKENGKVVVDPATGKPMVQERGVCGEAVQQARETVAKIEALKAQLAATPKGEQAKLRREIYELARSAVEKSLRASDETDFNSSYEIRDELVKKFYGSAERQELLKQHELPADADLVTAKDAYLAHFKDRPDVLARIEAATQPPHDPAKLELAHKALAEQFAYDAYAKQTILRLARDGLVYTEQSNSVKKLEQRFDKDQLAALKKQLIAEHHGDPKLVAQLEALEIKHLAMINTNNFGTRDGKVDQSDLGARAKARPERKAFDDEVKRLVEQCKRGDVVGVDIAGAEHYAMDAEGQARMAYLHEQLVALARETGHPVVLRPHVGEGANDVVPGKHGMRDSDRQMVNGELSHYVRAQENLNAMLGVFEQIAKAQPDGKLPPDVIVRFGHATHTTPEQAIRMAKLGIIAEVNLVSNIQTGSVSQQPPKSGSGDRAHDGGQLPLFPKPHESLGGTLEDHALVRLIAHDVPVILSTDAHAVMSTNMAEQYQRAKQLIDRVRAGELAVEIATGHSVKYAEMDSEMQRRFDDAYRKLYAAANDYHERRPKPATDDGPPPPRVRIGDGDAKAERVRIATDETDAAGETPHRDDPPGKASDAAALRDRQAHDEAEAEAEGEQHAVAGKKRRRVEPARHEDAGVLRVPPQTIEEPAIVSARIATEQLGELREAGSLDGLHEAIVLEQGGRLRGLSAWLDTARGKRPVAIRRALAELAIAKRLAEQYPGAVVDVSQPELVTIVMPAQTLVFQRSGDAWRRRY